VLGAAINADTRATVRRIVDQGSEVGNHTLSHPRLTTLVEDRSDRRDEMKRLRLRSVTVTELAA
jgi:peptidoglycan/xylan/chitin deacetylase (PgdA/CDA1 family)